MHATHNQPTGPNLFKPSLLAWRASYLARKAAASEGAPRAAAAESAGRQPRMIRSRRPAGRR
jgi:hypothetical protein